MAVISPLGNRSSNSLSGLSESCPTNMKPGYTPE